MRPVDDYLTAVLKEIATVTATAPQGLKMERLHLGGGTPTLLTGAQMERLLGAVHAAFGATRTFPNGVWAAPASACKTLTPKCKTPSVGYNRWKKPNG